MQGRKWRWICYSMLTRISSHRKRRERKQQSKGYINDIKCFCTKYRCAKIYVERCVKLIYSFVRLFLFRINRPNQRLKFNHKFVTSVSIFLVHFNCIVQIQIFLFFYIFMYIFIYISFISSILSFFILTEDKYNEQFQFYICKNHELQINV